MLNALKKLFTGAPAPAPAETPLDVAAAALMVEAASADQDYTAKERSLILEALRRQFFLSDAAAAEALETAERIQADAVGLHRFTKAAKAMPEADRIALVETLWRIVLSDKTRDPYEESLIRRVCALIYVSDVESGGARRRVEAAMSTSGPATGV